MPAPLNDRLGELLDENQVLYGMICRDATRTDIELLAQAGYHIAWIDLEHSHQSSGQALELCRTASHLGMVPLVRMIELSRTHVQRLLDGGADIVALPTCAAPPRPATWPGSASSRRWASAASPPASPAPATP